MERMTKTSHGRGAAASTTTRDTAGTGPCFTWNRTHTIFLVVFGALLVIIMAQTAFNTVGGWSSGQPVDAMPLWLRLGLGMGGAALGVANVIAGLMRRGSLTMPAVSAALTFAAVAGLGSLRAPIGADVGGTLANLAVTLVWFAIAAFIPFAIAHYGLRALFADPDPATRTGRLTLRVLGTLRRDPVMAGCWVMLLATFGFAVAVRLMDRYGFATAMVAAFVTPVAMTALSGLAAWAGPRGYRPVIAGAVLQLAFLWSLGSPVMPDGCAGYATSQCMTLPNGWGLYTDTSALVPFLVIPAAAWTLAYLIGAALRRHAPARGGRDAGVSDRSAVAG